MDRQLFRRRALAARQRQWFAPVTIVTPVSATALMFAAACAALLLSFAVWAIEVPDKIRVSGVLLPRENFVEIRALRTGQVRQLQVDNGSLVEDGQALLVIHSATHAPDQDALAAEQIDSLERELQLLDAALQMQLSAIERRVDAGRSRRAALENRLQLANKEREMQKQIAGLQERAARRVATLASSMSVSQQQADEYRMASIRARVSEQQLASETVQLEADIDLLAAQLLDDEAEARQQRTGAAMRREALQREISRLRAGAAAEILAASSGQVAGVSVTEGSSVTAGELLMTLHQPASPTEVRLYVPASQSGRIKTGQEVRLKLDAFPEQLYGAQTAKVTGVSSVALAAEDLPVRLPLRGLVFEVRARTTGSDNVVARLPPGTEVSADIVRHRWPLLSWLFSSRRGIAS